MRIAFIRPTRTTVLRCSAALGVLAYATLGGACSKPPRSTNSELPPASVATAPVPEVPAAEEPLALHMRDHLSLVTQARDALIRGRLEDANGALVWLAQHHEPHAVAKAKPFLDRIHLHAQQALDSSELSTVGAAIGALAATCGECHSAYARGPRLEPSGFEDFEAELTVASHMHGYLWATETLWSALIADGKLWSTGVSTLATLKPPSTPQKLASGFAGIKAWATAAHNATTPSERGKAYGELIARCGACHVQNAVSPG